jgi:hypothetical protein
MCAGRGVEAVMVGTYQIQAATVDEYYHTSAGGVLLVKRRSENFLHHIHEGI